MYQIIVDECARSGGPTELCQRIYRNLEGNRSWYWRAVQEGVNRYCARCNIESAALQDSQLTQVTNFYKVALWHRF